MYKTNSHHFLNCASTYSQNLLNLVKYNRVLWNGSRFVKLISSGCFWWDLLHALIIINGYFEISVLGMMKLFSYRGNIMLKSAALVLWHILYTCFVRGMEIRRTNLSKSLLHSVECVKDEVAMRTFRSILCPARMIFARLTTSICTTASIVVLIKIGFCWIFRSFQDNFLFEFRLLTWKWLGSGTLQN